MNRFPGVLAIAALAVGAWPVAARAQEHDIRAHISAAGVDFLETEIPRLVGAEPLAAPPVLNEFLCTEIEQRNTEITLDVQAAQINLLASGHLQLNLQFAAVATGELSLEDVFACFGSVLCQDEIVIEQGSASIELATRRVAGRATLEVVDVSLVADEDDVEITISGCSLGGAATGLIDFLPGFLRQSIIDNITGGIEENAGTMLGELLDGFIGGSGMVGGDLGFAQVSVGLEDIDIRPSGIGLAAGLDVSASGETAECVAGKTATEPGDQAGAAPDLLSGSPAHLALAVNFGAVDDLLHHVWRGGLLCLDDDSFAAFGIPIDFEVVSEALPGLPPGTELSIDIVFGQPPSFGPGEVDGDISLALRDVAVTIVGELPGGGTTTFDIAVEGTASGRIGIDPATNALAAQIRGVDIASLQIDTSGKNAAQLDSARILWVLEELVLPSLFEDLGQVPVYGAVVAFAGYALILRDLSASAAYLSVKADLFRIPTDDSGAPDTLIESAPSGPVSPKTARIQVTGSDAKIPSELLRYQVKVDGVDRPLTYFRELKVGQIGVSKTHEVEIRAVDLSDNVDPTPATVQVQVDGIGPALTILGERVRRAKAAVEAIEWTLSDDTTPAGQLAVTMTVLELDDPTDPLTARVISEHMLSPGQTSAQVESRANTITRVEIAATDSVGNESRSSLMIDTTESGGCSTGRGRAAGSGAVFAALAAVVAFRRRRRR